MTCHESDTSSHFIPINYPSPCWAWNIFLKYLHWCIVKLIPTEKYFILILLSSGNIYGIDLRGFVHIAKAIIFTDLYSEAIKAGVLCVCTANIFFLLTAFYFILNKIQIGMHKKKNFK